MPSNLPTSIALAGVGNGRVRASSIPGRESQIALGLRDGTTFADRSAVSHRHRERTMKLKSPSRRSGTSLAPSHVTRLRMMALYAWRDDVLTEGRPAPLPAESTDAPIGSADRLAIYEARAERGEQLHHPDDTRLIHSPEADSRRSRKRAADRLAARISSRNRIAATRSR